MRPINRGEIPKNQDGSAIKYSDYTQARGKLIERMGEYCSYCEMQLDSSLAVEHVQPKKTDSSKTTITERELNWHNFLLSCTNCNSTKGNKDVVLEDYLWPDRDNTFKGIAYKEGGLVCAAPGPKTDEAKRLIKLVGLDKTPTTSKASDRRWLNRKEAWDMGMRAKRRLSENNIEAMKEQIVDTIKSNGYWSIWMTIFSDNSDMKQRFITTFPGTAENCFDANNNYEAIPRPGGQL